MKRRILLILILLLLTCGCTCEYNLYIDENNYYYETTTLTSEGNEGMDRDYLYSLYLDEYPIYYSQEFIYEEPSEKIDGNTYYDKNIILDDQVKAIYKAKFDNVSYKDSRMMRASFTNRDINYNARGEYYYLNLSKLNIFNGANGLTKIKVNITVSPSYVVIYNNADSVNDNTYTWVFDSEDSELNIRYQTKEAYERLKNTNQEKEPDKQDDKNSKTKIIIGVVCLLAYLLLIIVLSKKNKNKK